jgi:hypothetical protein
MAADDNPDEEIWMFIDEYDDREAYMSSLLNAQKTHPTSADNYCRFMEIAISNSIQKREVWTEMEALRVDFRK